MGTLCDMAGDGALGTCDKLVWGRTVAELLEQLLVPTLTVAAHRAVSLGEQAPRFMTSLCVPEGKLNFVLLHARPPAVRSITSSEDCGCTSICVSCRSGPTRGGALFRRKQEGKLSGMRRRGKLLPRCIGPLGTL